MLYEIELSSVFPRILYLKNLQGTHYGYKKQEATPLKLKLKLGITNKWEDKQEIRYEVSFHIHQTRRYKTGVTNTRYNSSRYVYLYAKNITKLLSYDNTDPVVMHVEGRGKGRERK